MQTWNYYAILSISGKYAKNQKKNVIFLFQIAIFGNFILKFASTAKLMYFIIN